MIWITVVLLIAIYLVVRNYLVSIFVDHLLFTEKATYSRIPNYYRMVFSFKPLEEKYWIKK